mmetsp:Transcript_15954/g.41386  ORF Transcript_15954/g.41386 Transcript_15954/m.41386 type:complete len:220 (-) Transcript_15954:197-856(-)
MREAVFGLRILLCEVHQPRAVSLHLLGRGDGAEGDLTESLGVERAVRDAAHHGVLVLCLDDAHRAVPPVHHQPRDVLLGHVGQLLGEDVLQPDQPHVALVRAVVLDVDKRDLPGGLLRHEEALARPVRALRRRRGRLHLCAGASPARRVGLVGSRRRWLRGCGSCACAGAMLANCPAARVDRRAARCRCVLRCLGGWSRCGVGLVWCWGRGRSARLALL